MNQGQIPENLCHVGKGWHGLLVELHEQIVELDPEYELAQVKEKFGGLRVYLSSDPECAHYGAIQDLIEVAEKKADQICEQCGTPGSLREGSWLLTLCDACQAARLKRQSFP